MLSVSLKKMILLCSTSSVCCYVNCNITRPPSECFCSGAGDGVVAVSATSRVAARPRRSTSSVGFPVFKKWPILTYRTTCVWPAPPLRVTQYEFCRDLRRKKTGVSDLSCGVVCVILFGRFETIPACDGQTDRGTDRSQRCLTPLPPPCRRAGSIIIDNVQWLWRAR